MVTFPGESVAYRAARNRLLEQEIMLRRQMEAVAAARRALPAGGVVPEDYVFDAGMGASGERLSVKLSELFGPTNDSLAIYSMMFPRDPSDKRLGAAAGETSRLPLQHAPCPSCTALLDQLEGVSEHLAPLMALVVIAKAPQDWEEQLQYSTQSCACE